MIKPIQSLLNKRINIKQITSCALSLVLAATPAALAGYIPPPTQNPAPPEQSTTTGGRRGGCHGGDLSLTALASWNHVGQTISRHPTFAWFVPPDSGSRQMIFMIYKVDREFKKIIQIKSQSSPGIMKLSPFTQNELGLEVGKKYLWQVVIICDKESSSSHLLSVGSIEVVERPDVQLKLEKAVNSLEKVNIYAQEGLWYNALGEALNLAEPSKLGKVGSDLLKDLAKWETPNVPDKDPNPFEKWLKNWKQIAENER